MDSGTTTDEDLLEGIDELNGVACRARRRMLALLAEAERLELWLEHGAHDMAHFVSMRYGISWWKADRWMTAARALPHLPLISKALERGDLSLDKVVELTRFATTESEAGLVGWASEVSASAIRRRADLEVRRSRENAQRIEDDRYVRWWTFDEGRRFALEAELPAADGAVVAGAIDRLAARIPTEPKELGSSHIAARRADALVAMTSGTAERDADPAAAMIVIHSTSDALASDDRSCEIEGGGIVHVETARRLACAGRHKIVVEDSDRNALGMGPLSRDPSAATLRQLRYRDRECRFPGCGARRFTHAHHIRWRSRGGRHDLENLVLVCAFHHKLVHEHGWAVARDADNSVRWYRPDGSRYTAGPAPPQRLFATGYQAAQPARARTSSFSTSMPRSVGTREP